MIANSVFMLAAWGALGSIFASAKSGKMMSFLTLAISSGLFFFLCQHYFSGKVEYFSFEWLKYMSLQVEINLSSTAKNYIQIFPIYIISLLSMFISFFSSEEVQKQRFCSLITLNLCAFIGVICATNILQLLVCSCFITVFGFCIINDMDARKKYAFYNLLADLSLFSVCSLAYSYIGSLELSSLPKFAELGAHRDLVSILLVIAVWLKMGLFVFHNQLYDLSVLQFNRLTYLLLCSTPLSGLLILQKFYPLTQISPYALPLLKIITVLTICSGVYNALLIDNIKEKAIGLMQILLGFSLVEFLFYSTDFVAIENTLLLGGALFGLILYAISYSSSNEIYISSMGNFISGLKVCFLFLSLAFLAFAHHILITYASQNYVLTLGFLFLFTIVIAHIYRQIFFGESHADERVMALLKNPAWYMLIPILALSIWFAKKEYDAYYMELSGTVILFITLLWFYPLKKMENLYQKEFIQESDVFETVFDFLIITPLTILGRILWLLVDFILIERTIINSLSNATNLLIRGVSHLNVFSAKLYLLYILLGFGLMALLAYMGHK